MCKLEEAEEPQQLATLQSCYPLPEEEALGARCSQSCHKLQIARSKSLVTSAPLGISQGHLLNIHYHPNVSLTSYNPKPPRDLDPLPTYLPVTPYFSFP